MKPGNKALIGVGAALAALGGVVFLVKKKETTAPQPAPAAAAAVSIPSAQPAARPAPVPEEHISPAQSYQDTPPEQWTQEQASQATSDSGNAARDALGKMFGF